MSDPVTDDDPNAVDRLNRTLQGAGPRVVTASDSREGFHLARSLRSGAITLGVPMPVMDGFAFVIQLRKVEVWRGIPIVAVTGKDITDEDRRRLDGDVVGLVQKSGVERSSRPRCWADGRPTESQVGGSTTRRRIPQRRATWRPGLRRPQQLR